MGETLDLAGDSAGNGYGNMPPTRDELVGRIAVVSSTVDGYFTFQPPVCLTSDGRLVDRWQWAVVSSIDPDSDIIRCNMVRTPDIAVAAGAIRHYRMWMLHSTTTNKRYSWAWTAEMSLEAKLRCLPLSDQEFADFFAVTHPNESINYLASIPATAGLRAPLYAVPFGW